MTLIASHPQHGQRLAHEADTAYWLAQGYALTTEDGRPYGQPSAPVVPTPEKPAPRKRAGA